MHCAAAAGAQLFVVVGCVHPIAQVVLSALEAHFAMHPPHAAFFPISPINAVALSTAVPTPITSAMVHTAGVTVGVHAAGAPRSYESVHCRPL